MAAAQAPRGLGIGSGPWRAKAPTGGVRPAAGEVTGSVAGDPGGESGGLALPPACSVAFAQSLTLSESLFLLLKHEDEMIPRRAKRRGRCWKRSKMENLASAPPQRRAYALRGWRKL